MAEPSWPESRARLGIGSTEPSDVAIDPDVDPPRPAAEAEGSPQLTKLSKIAQLRGHVLFGS